MGLNRISLQQLQSHLGIDDVGMSNGINIYIDEENQRHDRSTGTSSISPLLYHNWVKGINTEPPNEHHLDALYLFARDEGRSDLEFYTKPD